YLRTHGDPGWERRPTYLPTFCPAVLESLDRLGLRITFFLVGVDATREENVPALRSLVAAGHEVGNHSHEHEPWLHLYSREQVERELAQAETAIEAATGQRPRGFRGPGFSWSPTVLDVLEARGYGYDASTFPTYLGPLARTYYFWTAKLSREERERRKALFGAFSEGFRPLKPYHWQLGGGRRLLEIPVTTMPVLRAPFHLSYLLFLSRYSEALMAAYLRTALALCRAAGVEPSFLLHPLDILGGDQVPELAFFPGMDLPHGRKTALFERALRILGDHFELVPMSAHAAAIERRPVPARVPALAA
ncbi:MAG TPA: polysaccharide deacetylase family protein, partial [Gemmatimonadales bacterium]|nr:polysaccharide deacetylase family protein [Gemmatimonadales bacterium]